MDKRASPLCKRLEKSIFIIALITIDTSLARSYSLLNLNPEHRESYVQQPKSIGKSKYLHGSPLWNNYLIPVKEMSDNDRVGYGYGPHELHTHHPHKPEHNAHLGFVNVLNEFIGVMGPFLFPLPYFLALLPFALPAIPIALWFDRTNGEHHPPGPGHMNMTNHPTEPSITHQSHPTLITTLKPLTQTPTSPTNLKPPTQTPSTTTTKRIPTVIAEMPTSPKPMPTKPTTVNPPLMMSSSNFTSSSSNSTEGEILQPPIDFPQTPPLFPFPLFLNSSWLSVDYNNADQYWQHRSE